MFSNKSHEIIDSLPQDAAIIRVVHPTGACVDITRAGLVDGLKAVESLSDPKYTLRSVEKSIKKLVRKELAGKKYDRKNLCDDVAIWFCYSLLKGERSLQMVRSKD